jgi:sugar (pentulose or hexulose) kinase
MSDLVLAIDLGSSWCKAAYVDAAGRLVASGRAYTRAITASRDAMLPAFWQALCTAVRSANRQLSVAIPPAAIGISCRAQFGVCLDATGAAFWPVWDCLLTKSSPELQRAYAPELWGEQDPYACGYGVRMGALLAWLHQQRPDEWGRIQRVGALHNYLVYRLAGVWVTDPTSGAEQARWPQAILDLTGLPENAFPLTLPAHELAGGLTADAAAALGLPVGTAVVVGLHDGAAANLGTRAVEAGDVCLTLGTNFVFRAVNGARLSSGSFCYTVAPERWAWVNNVPGASTQLDLVAETLYGAQPTLAERHQVLGQLADQSPPGAGGLVIQRMIPGEEAAFVERIRALRRTGYTEGVIYRALAEAIAVGVHHLMQTAIGDGIQPRRFVAMGGSVQNRHFLRVLSAVLAAPLEIGAPEAGLLGAGMVAAVGCGWHPTVETAMTQMTATGPLLQPEPTAVHFYQTFLQSYATVLSRMF